MTLETQRLTLIALDARQLELLTRDTAALERELEVKYRAEPLEGFFLGIVENQQKITREDESNYLWHTFWLIVRRDDCTVVGSADFKRPPDENGEVEIGYGLGAGFEHNGYMTETVRAMSGWALAQAGVKHVIAETERDNLASQHILERCGFRQTKAGETLWWRL